MIMHLALALLATLLTAVAPQTTAWRPIVDGLETRRLVSGVVQLEVYRVDLRRLEPRIVQALPGEPAEIAELADQVAAPLAVNGSFFDERGRPLGLLVDRRRELNPLRRADWGVLAVRGGRASLVHTKAWRGPTPDFAIQVGPRVVVDGGPVKLKAQIARRVAIGIIDPQTLVVVISVGPPVESNALARVMAASEADGGLGCHDALMLDGGGSAQLQARVNGRRHGVRGQWPVPNGVAFVPRAR